MVEDALSEDEEHREPAIRITEDWYERFRDGEEGRVVEAPRFHSV